MKFAVAARDPQVDIYREDDFYGLEVVEAEEENEALQKSQFNPIDGLLGLHTWVYEVDDSVEVGWYDNPVSAKKLE